MQLDDATLIQFALGTLTAEEVEQVEQALSVSSDLRSQLADIQESLTTLSLAEAPLRPNPPLREKILQSAGSSHRFTGFASRFAELFDLGKEEVERLLAKIDKPGKDDWTPVPLLGPVDILVFPGGARVADATCGLVSVKPGTVFPHHRHQGEERTLVLQGTARESNGRIQRPGDIVISSTGSEHAFRVLGSEKFVYAVVLEADNRWLIGRTLLDRLFADRRFPQDPGD